MTYSSVQLAAGAISRRDGVSIELHRPADSSAYVLVLWPPRSTVLDPSPKALAELGRAMVRVLGQAQTELSQQRQQGGPR
jgi:hypothetical protein